MRQRIRSVLEWAIAIDLRNDNACDCIGPILGPQNDIVAHRLALPHMEVAVAIETVRTSDSGAPAVRLAFEQHAGVRRLASCLVVRRLLSSAGRR